MNGEVRHIEEEGLLGMFADEYFAARSLMRSVK
jgi:hypothetical protein